MVASSASRRYSQRLGESCWFSAAEKPRTAFQSYSMGFYGNVGSSSLWIRAEESEKVSKHLLEVQNWSNLIEVIQKVSFCFAWFHQDLSSMLVVKPDGSCLAQSDAVVFAWAQDC